MPSLPERADLVIVGAGTAGAAAAMLAARRGLRVIAIDRAPLDQAGAHWINAVPGWQFDGAEVPRPRGQELVAASVPYHLFAGRGGPRAVAHEHDVLEVDMARLVARLQEGARDAGAILEGGVSALGVEGASLRTDRGTVRADAIVDASGLAGARLLGDPGTPREDLCSAAQEVRVLRDRASAEAFFAAHGVPLGHVMGMGAVAGGYSILNVRVVDDHVSLLAGTIPAGGHPSGKQLLARFAEEHASFVGDVVRAGSRAIPLGRPVDVLARGRVARIGDAARMLFAAHGSGVGAGLVAARLLADELGAGRGLDHYAVRFMREHGGLFAASDVFRRFTQGLTVAEVRRLLAAELLDARLLRSVMSQERMELSPTMLGSKTRAVAREARLVAAIGRTAARAFALEALHRAYPRGERAQLRWARAARRIAGA